MGKIKLLNSSSLVGGAPKAPPTLSNGEIAINYAAGFESIFMRNSNNQMCRIPVNLLKNLTGDVQQQLNGKANIHGYEGYDYMARELRLYGEGIHFLRYGNDAGGWDGADIYIDNEGNKDKSKLIFKIGDDVYDSFSFRVVNINPLNIIDTGINVTGDCNISKNLNVTSWVFGKDALFSGGVQCDGGISSSSDVRAGNKARFFTNSGVTGWLQLGDGDYKHAVISAYYGNNIDDLEIKANQSIFSGNLKSNGDIIAYNSSTYSAENQSPTPLDILIEKNIKLEKQIEKLNADFQQLKSKL